MRATLLCIILFMQSPGDTKSGPRFSLILPTLGRTDELERLLNSLLVQSRRDFEVIVVDQNVDERLAPVLEPYARTLRLEHLRPGSLGASRARNAGLERASGEVLAFPDDDCWYPPDLLNRADLILRARPELDGLTGCSVDERGEASNARFDGSVGYLGRISVWSRAIEYTMFLRARSVRGLRFDESLGVGSGTAWGAGEATDYLLRLLDLDASIHYEPSLRVFHPAPVPPYDAKARLKAYSYGVGMGRVLYTHEMPAWFKAKWLVRPLGGTVLSAMRLKVGKAGYHWSVFRGRLKGMAS